MENKTKNKEVSKVKGFFGINKRNIDMSEIARAHTLVLESKASQRFPSMLKNTLRALARSVFDRRNYNFFNF